MPNEVSVRMHLLVIYKSIKYTFTDTPFIRMYLAKTKTVQIVQLKLHSHMFTYIVLSIKICNMNYLIFSFFVFYY